VKKLLITGASGQLGLNLALYAQRQGYDVIGWSNRQSLAKAPFAVDQFDLTDTEHLREKLEATAPDLVVHSAALANLEACDKNPELAYLLNAEIPGFLALNLKRMGVPLLHISTDAVFDGTKGDYNETDMPNPINTYAHSKLMGEENVISEFKDAIIGRVVFFGWTLTGKRSLAEFFYNRLKTEETVNGFTDMIFTPLYVEHLAKLLLEALEKELHGIYHFFGNQAASKYAFGVSLAREFGFDESLVSPISVGDSELTTKRSLNLSMNNNKLRGALGHELPGIFEGLKALHLAEDMGLREHILDFGRI
jgi:dTDP-4-dehydrorhamnose reductase